MDEDALETSVSSGATSRPLVGPVWWVVVLGVLTTAGLGALTLGLLLLHALAYGAVSVLAPHAQAAPPDSGRYLLAFSVSVIVHVASASATIVLAPRSWHPVVQGPATSLVAATSAGCALLLTVGISPVALVLDR